MEAGAGQATRREREETARSLIVPRPKENGVGGRGGRVPKNSHPNELIEQIRFLWEHEGLTAQAIGDQVGMTKNAIIGIAHRHGFTQRLASVDVQRMADRLSRLDAFPGRSACVWPIGHPKEEGFHFCGEKVVSIEHPYCPEHDARAYYAVKAAAE